MKDRENNFSNGDQSSDQQHNYDTLPEGLFSEDELISLNWLRQWYQSGGSDRVEIVRELEFLKYLKNNGIFADDIGTQNSLKTGTIFQQQSPQEREEK